MIGSLLLLCLAAFTAVSLAASAAASAALPAVDRLARRLSPRHRVRLWLGLAALPSFVGATAVAVSFLPAIGVGHDHCLSHGPHHPHLCLQHVGGAPGALLVALAGGSALLFARGFIGFAHALWLSRTASRTLAEASESTGELVVFPGSEPQAFVIGALRPRVYVSHGLLALGSTVVEAVLAHERVHASRHDLLWRALCPLLASGHFPWLARALALRLASAQEVAADAEAAAILPDGRLRIADALVLLAKMASPPAHGLSFSRGDVAARVHALLEDHGARPPVAGRVLVLGGLVATVEVAAAHDLVHHGLETLLGALS